MIKLFEAFAGYGTASFALKELGVEFELVGFSEIDKYAIQCFEQNHGGKNYGSITDIDWSQVPDFDLLTGGFPCQDVSTAGKQDLTKGRSILGFELTKALQKKHPKYFMFENVKGILSKRFKPFLEELLKQWKEAGYNVQYKILNTKDFGIPQNRERVFFIGIRKDIEQRFVFPEPFELKLKLIDVLEDNVDDKYYLTNKQIDSILNSTFNSRRALVQKKDICSCLAARDYKEPKVLFADFRNDEGLRIRKNGLSPCLSARKHSETDVSTMPPLIINPYNGKQSYEETGTIGTSVGSTTGKTAQLVWNQTPRKITPKECFRLQGFLRDQINLEGLSDTQKYKLAGNGQSLNVVTLIFKELLGKGVNKEVEAKE
jgi:DNA (cytosine-5)-methyltransferase 1